MAKKKEQKDMAQEQEQRLKFQQKLIEILELGKKKKNMENILLKNHYIYWIE